MAEPVQHFTAKPDKELAEDFRDRLVRALEPVCEVCTDAARHGLHLSFNVAPDGLNISRIQSVGVTRKLI